VSRGRLLHHFPSREELLVAAASHLVNEMLAEAAEQAEHLDVADPVERVERCVELNWALFQKPPFWAAMELWNAARTDEALRTALRAEERRLNQAIRAAADRIWGPAAKANPRYPVLRELLFTSMRGVAIAYSFEDRPAATDPHLSIWKDLAREMLD
jgi:AcrR family transcriptional regulator